MHACVQIVEMMAALEDSTIAINHHCAAMMNSISDGGCIKTELYGNTPALLYRLSKCVLIEMELAEPRRSLSCSSS